MRRRTDGRALDSHSGTASDRTTGTAWLLLLLLCALLPAARAWGGEDTPQLQIADPYIELHTGPGRGYPVFYVVERKAWVELLQRQTDWYKVRAARGRIGWVHREQLARTLQPDGTPTEVPEVTREDYDKRRWELTAMSGDFDGINVINLTAGYALTANLSAELAWSKTLGAYASSELIGASLVHQPFPEWRWSPFFTLGTGSVRLAPAATLVQPHDRRENYIDAGIGVKYHLTRRFLLRAEYKNYVLLTNRNKNEEPKEWKLGFAFFF
jgi:hypothetical protein